MFPPKLIKIYNLNYVRKSGNLEKKNTDRVSCFIEEVEFRAPTQGGVKDSE